MFLHWLVGMVYVFYFASFVLLLREVLRPGVLWFLRNLNDPDFHPVQEVGDFFKLCPRIDYQSLFAKWSHVSPAEDFREDRKLKPRKRSISSLVMVDPLSKLFKELSPREENREPWEIWSVFSQGCCVSVKLKTAVCSKFQMIRLPVYRHARRFLLSLVCYVIQINSLTL